MNRRPSGQLREAHEGRAVGRSRAKGQVYNWPKSTYIAEPPFFDDFSMTRPRRSRSRARAHWACSATRSRPTTSARPARSRKTRRPASG
jgi:aconitate hydratase